MSPRTFRWRRGRPSGVCLNKFTVMKMRKEVKIGIFTVAILALLYWGINFLKGRDLFNRNMTYYAYYDNVSGIQMSSPIIVQGIRVGAVTGIKFRPDLNNTVEVKFDVKSAYRVPDNSVVRLFTNGIMPRIRSPAPLVVGPLAYRKTRRAFRNARAAPIRGGGNAKH